MGIGLRTILLTAVRVSKDFPTTGNPLQIAKSDKKIITVEHLKAIQKIFPKDFVAFVCEREEGIYDEYNECHPLHQIEQTIGCLEYPVN